MKCLFLTDEIAGYTGSKYRPYPARPVEEKTVPNLYPPGATRVMPGLGVTHCDVWVTPFNILWALVSLNFTYVTRPLNRSLWILPCYEFHAHISFYAPLLDAPLLLVEIWYHIRDNAESGHTAVSGMVRLRRAI
jgi:hypothetical protein